MYGPTYINGRKGKRKITLCNKNKYENRNIAWSVVIMVMLCCYSRLSKRSEVLLLWFSCRYVFIMLGNNMSTRIIIAMIPMVAMAVVNHGGNTGLLL